MSSEPKQPGVLASVAADLPVPARTDQVTSEQVTRTAISLQTQPNPQPAAPPTARVLTNRAGGAWRGQGTSGAHLLSSHASPGPPAPDVSALRSRGLREGEPPQQSGRRELSSAGPSGMLRGKPLPALSRPRWGCRAIPTVLPRVVIRVGERSVCRRPTPESGALERLPRGVLISGAVARLCPRGPRGAALPSDRRGNWGPEAPATWPSFTNNAPELVKLERESRFP